MHRQERAEFRASARPLAAVASIISGIAWLAWELSRRVWDDGASSDCAAPADFYNDATFAVATVAAAVALAALFWLLRGALRWFCLAAAVGAAAWGVGNSVEHCVAEPFFLLYAGGGLMYVLASLRARGRASGHGSARALAWSACWVSQRLGRWWWISKAAAQP